MQWMWTKRFTGFTAYKIIIIDGCGCYKDCSLSICVNIVDIYNIL